MVDPFSIGTLATETVIGVMYHALSTIWPAIWDYLITPSNRHVLMRIVWVLCVVVALGMSIGAILGGHALWDTYKPGIVITVVLWALLFGVTASLVLPSKVVVAIFGGLVGVSASEIGAASGLVSIARKQVSDLAVEIGAIANPVGAPVTTPDPFISWMIWLFLVLIALLCLPAFFEKDTSPGG